ncbi:MAG: CoA transferase [Ilumatobacteraceae bacterium]|nr:CoA transferase [Ilumatobacteraceae bacterium]
MTTNQPPLTGIKVVDMSTMISGPLTAMMLADYGADVIKIESPGQGDLMRYLGTQKNGLTGLFHLNNRGKRSIGLNVKSKEGLEVLTKLIAEADVFVQNYRPGALERLGLGYEDVKKFNPGIIYVSISGYGPDGPNSHRRVYDNVIQAASGVASVQSDPGTGKPQMLRNLACDKVTSYTAMQSICAALFARERGTAQGQHIVLAMLDAAVSFLWPDAGMDATVLDDDATRMPTLGANYNVTVLEDGYCASSAVSDVEFKGLWAALGRPDLADDPRFSTAAARSQNAGELVKTMKELSSKTKLADFLRVAEEHDLPASPVNSIADLPNDAQIKNNKIFVERTHPVMGKVREVRPAARFSDTELRVSAPAPMRGEHSDDIVREIGLDPASLREAGAIF